MQNQKLLLEISFEVRSLIYQEIPQPALYSYFAINSTPLSC